MNFSFARPVVAIESAPPLDLKGEFERSGTRTFSGYAFDALHPDQRLAVELLVDGCPVAVTLADRPCEQPEGQGFGDNCHGFRFTLEADIELGSIAEARIANVGTPNGLPIRGTQPPVARTEPADIRWLGGLHFSGWILEGDAGDDRIRVLVDDQLISEIRPVGWTAVGSEGDDRGTARTLDFHVPRRFADGALHSLTLELANGTRIPRHASVQFVAPAGGFASVLSDTQKQERLRAALLDRLLPMSLPFSSYADWRSEFPPDLRPTKAADVAFISVGSGNMSATVESLEAQTVGGWVAASLPPVTGPFSFKAADAHAFLEGEAASCTFIVLAMAGTRLAPTALQQLAAAFEAEDVQLAYSDVEICDRDGGVWPIFFPAFDYERQLEQGYAAHFFAMRRDAFLAALTAGASDIYRVFNVMLDDGADAARAIVHLPGALATLPGFDIATAAETLGAASRTHLRARGVFVDPALGESEIFPAVRVARPPSHRDVAIVVTTRNNPAGLRRCLASLAPAVEAAGAHLIVVDNDSSGPEARSYLSELEAESVEVIHTSGAHNAAKLANIGSDATRARTVCWIEDHIEARDETWLEELLGRMEDPEVGAVGPLMLGVVDRIAHAGVILGPAFAVAPAFTDRAVGDPGYGELLGSAHQQSALGAGCVMARVEDVRAVGGFDAIRFPNHFYMIDLCLKLRALGRRIVVTPHARMLTGKSGGTPPERELANLRAKWGAAIVADPFYSPLLSLNGAPFSALAWPPGSRHPRIVQAPQPADLPPGF